MCASLQYAYASPRCKFIQKYNAKWYGAYDDFNNSRGKIESDLTLLQWTLIFQTLTLCALYTIEFPEPYIIILCFNVLYVVYYIVATVRYI